MSNSLFETGFLFNFTNWHILGKLKCPEGKPSGILQQLVYAVSSVMCSPSTQIRMEEIGDSKDSMIFSEMGSSRSR